MGELREVEVLGTALQTGGQREEALGLGQDLAEQERWHEVAIAAGTHQLGMEKAKQKRITSVFQIPSPLFFQKQYILTPNFILNCAPLSHLQKSHQSRVSAASD